jgi:hypothetical protein
MKKREKKLVLAKETVRKLQGTEMGGVVGGSYTCTWALTSCRFCPPYESEPSCHQC